MIKNFCRHLSVTAIGKQQPSLVKLKRLQAHYQADDGLLVWQKAGLRDRILYGITLAGCAVGMVCSIGILYDLAKPPSWQKKE